MQKSKIKKIGNSWYVKLPPKLHKNMDLHDNDEIFLNKLGNRIEIIFNTVDELNRDALKDLNEGISLGTPIEITRDELYETNRY
ncbi:MAG: AbrB/MazE/SpoVT family DNA-binding domain-containing protein [Candidatus Helarchaeota archaeon]